MTAPGFAVSRRCSARTRAASSLKLNGFASIDELHYRVLQELAAPGELWLGHKLLLSPAELKATLQQTDLRCLLLLRHRRALQRL